MNARLILLTLLCSGVVTALSAADDAEAYRRALFNGENLYGWHVTGCKAGVEDSLLVTQAGDGFVRTDHEYRDFVLELEYRPRKADSYDAGVYFRAALPAEGKPWPQRYQVNLKQGDEGNLIGFADARGEGLVKPGDWNRLRLTVVADKAALQINGKPAWETTGVETERGYIGIQVEEPLGGQFEFRNIHVTELGYRSLFNGKDFAGWEGAGQEAATSWKVEEGLLVCTGKKGTWLRSLEQYGDFNLRMEYKLRPGGNSGVYLRVPKSGVHHGKGSGVEVQILDDRAERYKNLKPYQYCGSVYDFAPAQEHVGRPAGEWNALEINCRGTSYRVRHNGIVIVDTDESEHPGLAERLTKGFLGLQNHSEEVWFRHLRIGPAE